MTVNMFARDTARKYGVRYHDVRIAVNRICHLAGWERRRAEQYVAEVLAVRNDLGEAVEAVLRESAAVPSGEMQPQ